MSRLLDGVVFRHDEFVALLDAVNAQGIIGFNVEMPANIEATLASGLARLSAENWLEPRGDSYAIDGDIAAMMMALAYPDVVTLLTRDEPAGTRLFGHFQRGPVVMEFTRPTENEYRLSAIPNTLAGLQRIVALLDLAQDSQPHQFTLDQGKFFEVKRLIEQGERAAAARLLNEEEVTSADAAAFLNALATPQWGGQIAMLRVAGGEVSDARNIALVQGAENGWLIYQATPGEPQLILTTATGYRYQGLLGDYIRAIMQ